MQHLGIAARTTALVLGLAGCVDLSLGDLETDTETDESSSSPTSGPSSTTGGSATTNNVTGSETSGSSSTAASGESGGASTAGSGSSESTGSSTPCTAVDVLFVLDNSLSMEPFQMSLRSTVAGFIEDLSAQLPADASIRFAATTTEMAYSSTGFSNVDDCEFTGPGGEPASDFYVPPDESDLGTPGAQGRVLQMGGSAFAGLAAGSDPATVDAVEAWVEQAVTPGTEGSNIEMPGAAAAWAVDPINAPSNGNFLRDEGAVLALFFLTDEPDQSPHDEADALALQVAAAKAGCGGGPCVVAGGFAPLACRDGSPMQAIVDLATSSTLGETPQPLDLDAFSSSLADLRDSILETCVAI